MLKHNKIAKNIDGHDLNEGDVIAKLVPKFHLRALIFLSHQTKFVLETSINFYSLKRDES